MPNVWLSVWSAPVCPCWLVVELKVLTGLPGFKVLFLISKLGTGERIGVKWHELRSTKSLFYSSIHYLECFCLVSLSVLDLSVFADGASSGRSG